MELSLLKDIVIIFSLSTFVNLIFTRIKVPTVLGYLMTGVLAGPSVLSLIGAHQLELLAEIGVVLLLFTIGMEFSLKHLLKIRRIVFFGGAVQVSLTAGIFYLVSGFYNVGWQGGLFIGFLAALSSSALVLKLLQERSELTSNYGRTVLGILIFQDLLLVPLLLFTNLLGNADVDLKKELIVLTLKVILIIGMVYLGNKWLLPWLLRKIAMTKNQELFMMSILLICFAIALFTASLGMSLAFGAFLAGLMISESEYSHNAFANLVPFKDTFISFFFVSIGMLLDVSFVVENYQVVVISVLLIVFVKAFISGATGFLLGHTFRGTVVVGFALAQVGEFSFILAKIGLETSILTTYFYQLFIAVAVITMALTPFMMKLSLPFANMIEKLPLPKFLIKGIFPLKEINFTDIKNHLVIIGKDNSALKLSKMANENHIKHISVIFDPLIAKEKMDEGDLVVYGDAVNEPILMKAHVDSADIVVISVGDIIPLMSIIEKVKHLNKNAHIIARSKLVHPIEQLHKLGADQILPEKLEIAIDLFNRVLNKRLYTQNEINRTIAHIRSQSLGEYNERGAKNKPTFFDELPNMNISAVMVEKDASAVGKSLAEIDLRKLTGVTLLAVKRGKDVIEHPNPEIIFMDDDIAYVLGNPEQVNLAMELFTNQNVT